MNYDEKAQRNAQHRRRQDHLRLGTKNPKCFRCPEEDACCLELHHIAGQAFDQVTAIVCRNCHRKLSDMQLDHSPMVNTGDEPEFLEVVGRFLLGLADMFIQLVKVMREYGGKLIALAQGDSSEVQS